jgi:hypothetical protein
MCLLHPDLTRRLLEGAFKYLELQQWWQSLQRLSDEDEENRMTKEKLSMGLIAHILPYRSVSKSTLP